MRSKLITALTVIGAVTVLVLAANSVALATTGKALLAGKTNTASKLTSITRTTPGTGLQVRTKSTANAPFAVNGKGKVTNLNADTVDGLDSSALGTRALVWAYAGSTVMTDVRTWKVNLPKGTYLINYELFLPTGSGTVDCFVRRNSENLYAAENSSTESPDNLGTGVTGAGVVSMVSAGYVKLTCTAANVSTWNIDQRQPVRITAIPLPGYALQGAPSSARVAARSK